MGYETDMEDYYYEKGTGEPIRPQTAPQLPEGAMVYHDIELEEDVVLLPDGIDPARLEAVLNPDYDDGSRYNDTLFEK